MWKSYGVQRFICILSGVFLIGACDNSSEGGDTTDTGAESVESDVFDGDDSFDSGEQAPDSLDAVDLEEVTVIPELRLAATPVQLIVDEPMLTMFVDMPIAQDVDLITIHQDFYGIPWDEFASGADPPEAWGNLMSDLAGWTREQQRPVYLALVIGRSKLFGKSYEDEAGTLRVDHDWSVDCYNFDTAPDGERMRQAYVRYVEYMVELFSPEYLCHAVEVNMWASACDATDPGSFDSVITTLNLSYVAAKQKNANVVFPSIQIDYLYGRIFEPLCDGYADHEACLQANISRLNTLRRDRFAISTYPHMVKMLGQYDIPDDYLRHLADVVDEPFVIAESGFPSESIQTVTDPQAGTCFTVFESSPDDQAEYMVWLLAEAEAMEMDLLTWFSDRDVLPKAVNTECPCESEADFCSLIEAYRNSGSPEDAHTREIMLKTFGSIGLREYDGSAKPALQPWLDALD